MMICDIICGWVCSTSDFTIVDQGNSIEGVVIKKMYTVCRCETENSAILPWRKSLANLQSLSTSLLISIDNSISTKTFSIEAKGAMRDLSLPPEGLPILINLFDVVRDSVDRKNLLEFVGTKHTSVATETNVINLRNVCPTSPSVSKYSLFSLDLLHP